MLETKRNRKKTRKTKVETDPLDEVVFHQLEGGRMVAVSSGSEEHGAFEAWEANAAWPGDEDECPVRAESPARKTKRRASGRSLR